jgi:putative transcriptional regulator
MKGAKIINNLKSVRKSKGLTQASVARKVQISERHYQSIEGGEVIPNAYLAIKLAHTLETTVEQLFP